MKIRVVAINLNKLIDRKIIWGLFLAIACLFGSYVYLINSSVFNIAERKTNEEKIVVLEAEVSILEAGYLAKLGEINMDYISRLGFVDSAKNTTYAVVGNSTIGLLSVKNEI